MSLFYPVQILADWLTYNVFGLPHGSVSAEALNFFVYDTSKIFILLVSIIFIASFVRTFLPPEKIRVFLSGKHKYYGNVLAALLGIITPFCSCSAIPLFLGFVEAGVPLGATFSFLVSSPMINEIAVVMLLGLFGWRIMFIYILSGLVIAIVSGIVIGHLKVENLIEDFVFDIKSNRKLVEKVTPWEERYSYAKEYTVNIIKGIWIYVVAGVGLGAFIHGYVPSGFLAKFVGAGSWYAVPLSALVGIPLYSNAAGIIPLVSALTEKGVAMGTALSFMMSVTALSLPEFMILKKIMKPKLIFIFAGVVGIGIIFTGYLFNFILR